MNDEELWKDILGYEGKYKVSNTGRVVSLARQGGFGIHSRDKELELEKSWNGYLRVRLIKKKFLVHRLVAIAFIPNSSNLPSVNHKDGNKKNNNVTNLEWVNGSMNIKHAYDTGLLKRPVGEMNSQSKLTDLQRKEILSRPEKESVKKMAKEFGVSSSAISSLRRKAGNRDFRIKLSVKEKIEICCKATSLSVLNLSKEYRVSKSLISYVLKTTPEKVSPYDFL